MDCTNILMQGDEAKYQIRIDAEGFNMETDDFEIELLYGMMGKQAHVDKGINKAIAEMQDDKVIRVDEFAPNNLGANGHPSASAQQGWGETLTEYIKDLLDI